MHCILSSFFKTFLMKGCFGGGDGGGGPVGEGNAGKVWDEWGNLCLFCYVKMS